MLTEHDTAHTERLDAMETASETAWQTVSTNQAAAFKNLQDVLVAKIDALKSEMETLRAWHKKRRWAAAAGAGSMLLLLVALGLLLADTAPTRWLSMRLTGTRGRPTRRSRWPVTAVRRGC